MGYHVECVIKRDRFKGNWPKYCILFKKWEQKHIINFSCVKYINIAQILISKIKG